jgi:hypothetical protein
MSLTYTSFKTEIDKSTTFKDLTELQWESKIQRLDVHTKYDSDLVFLTDQFVRKINLIRETLRGDWSVVVQPYDGDRLRTVKELGDGLIDKLSNLLQKEDRLIEAFVCCQKEQQLRKDGLVKRTPHHTDYYADYTNGTDPVGGTVHDGLKEANRVATAGTDATHIYITQGAMDNDTDDNYNGDYLYNVTRSLGGKISDYDADDGAGSSVLTVASIANQVSTDTFYVIRAVKKLNTWAAATRVAGDRLFLRANTTWNQGTDATDIAPLTDGTIDDYISIIGCDSVTNDPWHDGSNTKPIIDFQDGAYQIATSGDAYWDLERLDLRQSNDADGILYIYLRSYGWKIIDCDFSDNGSTGVEGVNITTGNSAYFQGCTFTDCFGPSVKVSGGARAVLKDCTIDAGAIKPTTYGLYASGGGIIIAENCSIAPTTAFVTAEVYSDYNSNIYLRNCTFGVSAVCTIANYPSYIYSEDDDGVFEAHWSKQMAGIITRGTTLPRSGGADSYAILSSSTLCGPNEPLILGDLGSGFAKIWVATNAASTITVYVRVDSAWDSALTAAECYIKASYLDSASDCGRTLLQSAETISNSLAGDGKGVWTALTVTIPASNPKRDGWVYVWVCLAEYEDAGEYVHVDIKPVIS